MRRQIELANEVAAALSGSNDQILRALEGHVDCRLYLRGNVITLDGDAEAVAAAAVVVRELSELIEQGHEIAEGTIAAITQKGEPAPAGFEKVVPLETGGTVFPGLIELHNHVAYNLLPLWQVPQAYTNRNTWGNSAEYHQKITAPMKTIGEATDLLPALVRYVECKSLLGGVTTTQGIALFSAPGVRRYYRGIVRNVEVTGDPQLPEAGSRSSARSAIEVARSLPLSIISTWRLPGKRHVCTRM